VATGWWLTSLAPTTRVVGANFPPTETGTPIERDIPPLQDPGWMKPLTLDGLLLYFCNTNIRCNITAVNLLYLQNKYSINLKHS